jgi:hypothetical protein
MIFLECYLHVPRAKYPEVIVSRIANCSDLDPRPHLDRITGDEDELLALREVGSSERPTSGLLLFLKFEGNAQI